MPIETLVWAKAEPARPATSAKAKIFLMFLSRTRLPFINASRPRARDRVRAGLRVGLHAVAAER
jgi:hypothetical protein